MRRRRHRRGRGGVDGCRSRPAAARAGDERQRPAERRALLAARAVRRRAARPRARRGRARATTDITATGVSDPVTGGHEHGLPPRHAALHARPTARPRPSGVRAALARPRRTPATSAAAPSRAPCSRSTTTPPCARRARQLDENPCSMPARRTLTAAINAFVSAELGAAREPDLLGRDRRRRRHHPARAGAAAHLAVQRGEPRGRPAAAEGLRPASPARTSAQRRRPVRDAAVGGGRGIRHPHRRPVRTRAGVPVARRLPLRADGRARPARRRPRPDPARRSTASSPPTGCSTADSTLTGGYGAWSELPAEVSAALAWRSAVNRPSDGPVGGELGRRHVDAGRPRARPLPRHGRRAAAVVSVNTHADETRMLPGVPGAESGSFSDADLFLRRGPRARPRQLAGRLDLRDRLPRRQQPPDGLLRRRDRLGRRLLARPAATSGNTGYGLANNVTTALSERLLALYADWIGVSVHRRRRAVSSAGGAHVREAVVPGRPRPLLGLRREGAHGGRLLRPADVHVRRPTNTQAASRGARPDPRDDGGLTTAGLSFEPRFETKTAPTAGESYTVDGQRPRGAGQPASSPAS